MIPDLNDDGNLPPGIHECTLDELKERFSSNFHRANLFFGLEKGLEQLKKAGCKKVYIDGSYVTSKHRPSDFDICWDETDVDFDLLDPVLLDFSNRRASQKKKYSGEFFPACSIAKSPSTRFIDFFQIDKQTGSQKGIIQINLSYD